MKVSERVKVCMNQFAEENGIVFDENIRLQEQSLNSFLFVKLVIALEEEFEIEFETQNLEMTCFEYLKDISNYIEKKLEENE